MKAIDCLVNVDMGDSAPPDWMIRVKEDYFKGGADFLRSPELPELVDAMDAAGVERAILISKAGRKDDRARRYAEERPDRFALGIGGFNLLRPMSALRALESFVRDYPVVYATVGPSTRVSRGRRSPRSRRTRYISTGSVSGSRSCGCA
nr:hypothetical protein [Parafrankia soli]